MKKSQKPQKMILIGLDAMVATLVEKYLQAGAMPNLAALIRQGNYTRARALFPGVTPINWATISTGSTPGAHGIPDFFILEPGDPLDGGRDTFDGSVYQAETLWQAANRAGMRAATINFPGASPVQHPNHYWVAGRGSPAGVSSSAIRPTGCAASQPYLADLRDAEHLEMRGASAFFNLKPFNDPQGEGPTLHFSITKDSRGNNGVMVTQQPSDTLLTFLYPHQPSAWLWGDFRLDSKIRRGSYRLELVRLQPEIPAMAVYISEVTSPQDIAIPGWLGPALVERHGAFIDYSGGRGMDRGWSTPQRMVEEGRYKGLWQVHAAESLLMEYDCQLVMLKWHLLDHLQHGLWGGMDSLSPWYDPTSADDYEELIRSSYQAADEMIGVLLPLVEQGVTLVVTSDHGHIPHLKSVSLNNLMVKEGLIRLQPGDQNPPPVGWNQTTAFGGPGLGHVWVNLQGRQPQGIVSAEDYEKVRQQIIDTLLDLRDPQNNLQPVCKAMRREEARSMGLWGERVGDVVYWMEPGYSGDFNWSPISREGEVITPLGPHIQSFAEYGERKFIAHKFQSVHGCGDPGASLGEGTEESVFVAAGAGIRPGIKLDFVPDLSVVTPTIAAACSLPLPAQVNGDVLEDWLTP